MKLRSSHRHVHALTACSVLTFWPGAGDLRAQVLPSGMTVVAGQASAHTVGNTLTVNNSSNAILNWNSFSIGAGNAVRFEQPGTSSQVLNRVTGNDPSAILGSLSSNGRVWLLNPNGVLFGQGARVDVAGLVVSTLNLNNADWLAGQYRLVQGPQSPAGVVNQGELRSSLGGRIALVGATVRNEGGIDAPGGQVVLAAGSSVELIDSMTPNVGVKVNTSAGEVVNLGRLVAAGGRIDVHAATVNQQGIVRADSLSSGPGGEVVLQASDTLNLGAASQTTAKGDSGGKVTLQADQTLVRGNVGATGSKDAGGEVRVLGRQVGVLDAARVDVSGAKGGGEVLVGGGSQGKDPTVPNAQAVYFGPAASIAADAVGSGNGGRVILWSDQATRAYGSLSARGGAAGGHGGFVETSGGWLDARPGKLDLSAPRGAAGRWLLDPFDVTINDAGPDAGYDPVTFTANATGTIVSTAVIRGQLDIGNAVTISTGGGVGGQPGNITMTGATLNVTGPSPGSLTLIADGSIAMTGSTIQSSSPMNVSLLASRGGSGGITLQNSTINSGRGDITLGGFGTGTGISGSFANAAFSSSGYGVQVSNSTLDAGTALLSGNLSIAGASGALAGVSLGNGSVLRARNMTINGSSTAANGVEVIGASLTTPGDITVQGVGAQSGVVLNAGSSMNSSPAVSGSSVLGLAGVSTGSATGVLVAGDLTADNGNSVSVIGGNTGGPTPAVVVTGNVSVPATPGTVTLGIVNPAVDNSIVVNSPTLFGGGGIRIFGASSLTLQNTQAVSNHAIQLQADNIDFEGPTSLFSAQPTGDAIVLSNRNDNGPLTRFTNNSTITAGGSAALQVSSPARWIVWANDITGTAFQPGALPYDFTVYGATDPAAWSDFGGNGFASASAGVVTVTATINPRVYDTTQNVVLQSPLQGTGARGVVATFGSAPGVQFADKNVGTGKPVELVGSYEVSFADGLGKPAYGVTLQSGLFGDITPAPLLVTGLLANNKVYDATVSATLTGTGSVTPLGNDVVTVSAAPVGTFSDKNVGTAKSVSISAASLTGPDAGNYIPTASGLRADITPATLAIGGVTANSKVYDASPDATLGGTAAVAALGSDVVNVGGTPQALFSDPNVGTGKRVVVTGFTLSGADAGNYIAVQPGGLAADITPATLRYVAAPLTQAAGMALPPLTGTVAGFVGGETQQSATTGTLFFATAATSSSLPGRYAILGSGLSASNYVFVQDPANATALTLGVPSTDQTIVTGKIVDATPTQALQLMARPVPPADPALGGVVDLVPGTSTGSASPTATDGRAQASAASFEPVSVSSTSTEELAGILNARAEYKKALFADAIAQLQKDPALADMPPCRSREELSTGRCVVTQALKLEMQKPPAPATVPIAPPKAPAATPPTATAPATPAVPAVPAAPSVATPALPAHLLAEPRRVLNASLPQIHRKVALVVGLDRYEDPAIPPLANAVGDARGIGKVLESQMGYETIVLENATRTSVVAALNRLAVELDPKDSFVLYYAGHGELVESTRLGYWLLADSDPKRADTWLSNTDIGRMVAQIEASQVAVISDSCYSGSLVADQRIRAAAGAVDPAQVLARRSVVVMSSGGNEPVADAGKQGHSPFAWSLMNNLRQLSAWQPGGNVFERVRFAVAKELPQRPQYGAFSAGGHQAGGDYLFEQRKLEPGSQ